MLKRFWKRMTTGIQSASNTGMAAKNVGPDVVARSEHPVSRADISDNALKVLHRLNNAGYEAYLVGGGVRDLFLHLSPKDFDIATNAKPEQIRKLFRNCRLVGRRFRLAHILYGRDVIEVATFRGDHQDESQHSKSSEHGMLLRDNVYGDLRQDAFRRDFTINALYYCVKDRSVIDYVGGLADLNKKQLRLIGDPETRYREDPVRMLRAVRLSAKLELDIEKETLKPITKLASLLENIPAARLWDESGKMLLSGHAEKTWSLLLKLKLAAAMLPDTFGLAEAGQDWFKQFVASALQSTDKRIAGSLPVTPAFLFAVFAWPAFLAQSAKFQAKGLAFNDAQHKAASGAIDNMRQRIAIPKRFSIVIKEIWLMQNRLQQRKKRSIESILHHPRFRAAYDFMALGANNEEQQSLVKWWTEIQQLNDSGRRKMIGALGGGKNNKNKRRYHRKRQGQSAGHKPKTSQNQS